jgi:hypothetical protein
MGKHAKSLKLLEVAVEVLTAQHPMTVRQVYYQLVSRQVIENNRGQYQAVSNALVDARKEGLIPWDWSEDRLRRPREVSMYRDLRDFLGVVVYSYQRDVWPTQPTYVEVWLAKDALSGIFEQERRPYGVTLNVGCGYDGWDSIHHAAARYRHAWAGDIPTTVLYFGDFHPSGEDMVRSLGKRLEFFGYRPSILKRILTFDDISRYQLPPDFTKHTDTRRAAFVAKYGDLAVELDALPVDVLRGRLVAGVWSRMDLDALEVTRAQEEADNQALRAILRRT